MAAGLLNGFKKQSPYRAGYGDCAAALVRGLVKRFQKSAGLHAAGGAAGVARVDVTGEWDTIEDDFAVDAHGAFDAGGIAPAAVGGVRPAV